MADHDGGSASDTATPLIVRNDAYEWFRERMLHLLDDALYEQLGKVLAQQVADYAQNGSAYGVGAIEMLIPSVKSRGKHHMMALKASRLARSVSLVIVLGDAAGTEHHFTECYEIPHCDGAAPPPVWAGEKLLAIAATFDAFHLPYEWPTSAADDTIGLPVLQMCAVFCLALFDEYGHAYLCDALDAFKPVFNYTPAPLAIKDLEPGGLSPEQLVARDCKARVLDPGNKPHNGDLPWYAKTFDMTAGHAAEVCIAASRTIGFNASKDFGKAMASLFKRLNFTTYVRRLAKRALRQAKRHLEFLRDTLRYCGHEGDDAVAKCAQGQDYEAAVIAAGNYPVYGLLICGAVMRALYTTSVERSGTMGEVMDDPELIEKLMTSCTSDAFLGRVAGYIARNLVGNKQETAPMWEDSAFVRLFHVRLAIAPLASYAGSAWYNHKMSDTEVRDQVLKPVGKREDDATIIFRHCAIGTVRMCSLRGPKPLIADICESSRYRASLPLGMMKQDRDVTMTTEEYDTWLLAMAARAVIREKKAKVEWQLTQDNLPPPNSEARWLNADVVLPLCLNKKATAHATLLVEASGKHVGLVHYRFQRLMRLHPHNAVLPAMYLEACLSVRRRETLYVCVVDPCTFGLNASWCPHNWLHEALTDAVTTEFSDPDVILDYFGADCGDESCTSLQRDEPSCQAWQCVMYDAVARFGADNFDYVMGHVANVPEGRSAYYIMLMHLNNGTFSVSMATDLLIRTFGLDRNKLEGAAPGVELPEGCPNDLAWLATVLNENLGYDDTIGRIGEALKTQGSVVPRTFRPLKKFRVAVRLPRTAASVKLNLDLRPVERVSQLHLRVRQAMQSDRDWDVSRNMVNSCCAVRLGSVSQEDANTGWGKVGMTEEIFSEAIDLAGAGCTVLVNTNARIVPRLSGKYSASRIFVWLSGKDATWQHALMFYAGLGGRGGWDDGVVPGSERVADAVQIFQTYAQLCDLEDFNVNVAPPPVVGATGDCVQLDIRDLFTNSLQRAALKYIIACPNLVKCVYYASDAGVADANPVVVELELGGSVGVACVHPDSVSTSVDYFLFNKDTYVPRVAELNVGPSATEQDRRSALCFINRAQFLVFASQQNLDFARRLNKRCAKGAESFVAPIELWSAGLVRAFLVAQQVPMPLFTNYAERRENGRAFVRMCVAHTADREIQTLGLDDEVMRRSLLELVWARGARDFTEPMRAWSYGKARNFFGGHASQATIDALVPCEEPGEHGSSGLRLWRLVFEDNMLATLGIKGRRRRNPMSNWDARDVQKFLSDCCGVGARDLGAFRKEGVDGEALWKLEDAFLDKLGLDQAELRTRIAAYNTAVPNVSVTLSEPEEGAEHDDAWIMGTLVDYTSAELLERLVFYVEVEFPSELRDWTHEHGRAFLSKFDVSSETRGTWDRAGMDGLGMEEVFHVAEGHPHVGMADDALQKFLIKDDAIRLDMIHSLGELCTSKGSKKPRTGGSPEF